MQLSEIRLELAAVTEQRDVAREQIERFKSLAYRATILAENFAEQRDRLAEAIRKHKTAFPFAPDFCDVELYEALQSLKQDHTVDANDMIADVKGGSDE